MLDEIAIRKIKAALLEDIRYLNEDISRKQKEMDEHKKRIWIDQAKLSEVNKILEDPQ